MSVKLESMLLFIYARLKIKPFVFVFVDVKFGYAHKTGVWWDCELLHQFVKRESFKSYQPYPCSYPWNKEKEIYWNIKCEKTFIHFTITIKRSHQHLILFRLHHSIKSKMYSICSSIGLALSHGSLNNKVAYE